jgi:hypothetical protein
MIAIFLVALSFIYFYLGCCLREPMYKDPHTRELRDASETDGAYPVPATNATPVADNSSGAPEAAAAAAPPAAQAGGDPDWPEDEDDW